MPIREIQEMCKAAEEEGSIVRDGGDMFPTGIYRFDPDGKARYLSYNFDKRKYDWITIDYSGEEPRYFDSDGEEGVMYEKSSMMEAFETQVFYDFFVNRP